MKKSIITLVLAFVLLMCSSVEVFALTLTYNGEEHEYTGNIYDLRINGQMLTDMVVKPLIFNDYALVPIRDVFEAMGAIVKYVDDTKQILISYNKTYLSLKIGSHTAFINEDEVVIPGGVTPMLISTDGIEAKTMIPVRFASESLGFIVDFIEEEGLITIDEPKEPEYSNLTHYDINEFNEYTTIIKIYADKPLTSITEAKLTNSGVLYVDLQNCKYKLQNKNEINTGAVKSLRFGTTDYVTRIAIDVEDMEDYQINLSKDKSEVIVYITKIPPEGEKNDVEVDNTDKIVILDAGHGGTDPGALGVLDGITYNEKDINLDVTKKVKDVLERNGVKVVMTRSGDTYPTLEERAEIANLYNAAIFVSIHSNTATTPTANGFEVYYSLMNNDNEHGLLSIELAKNISKKIDNEVDIRNRGVKTADHVVTRNCLMPAVLVEIGFLSNEEELALMLTEEFRNSFATGIANGIIESLDKVDMTKSTKKNIDSNQIEEDNSQNIEETEDTDE